MDELKVQLRETKNYQLSIGNSGGRYKITATDVSDFIYTYTDSWITASHDGNELVLIILPNTNKVSRIADIFLKSKLYYDSDVLVEIIQSETVYKLTTSKTTLDGFKTCVEGEEKQTVDVLVEGSTKKCVIKDIKQYVKNMDSDTYYFTDFDSAISAKLKEIENGKYTLDVINYGKVTKLVTYYKIIISHKDNIDTESEIKVLFEDDDQMAVFLNDDNEKINVVDLQFTYDGYCYNNKIRMYTNNDNIDYTIDVDWLYVRFGFNCIEVFAEYNDADDAKDRSGTITVGNNTINVTQKCQNSNQTLLSIASNIMSANCIDNDIDGVQPIELINIGENMIEVKTYIFNDKSQKYDNDSKILVLITGEWLSYRTAYNSTTQTHYIYLSPQQNIWPSDRSCAIKILNSENSTLPLKLIATQSIGTDKLLKIEQLTID